jgi:hypothetical protein
MSLKEASQLWRRCFSASVCAVEGIFGVLPGGWGMSFNSAVWVIWIYGVIYYVVARWVRLEIARADPDYFGPDADEFGMGRASAMWRMLLDSKLPGNFDAKIKCGIYAARVMLVLYVPIVIAVLILALR